AGFSPSRFIREEEVKVRREAYKLAFRVPAERADALAAAGGDPELRILAIRVLGNATDDTALRSLLRLVERGRDWLGRARLAPPSPPMLAALTALASGWSEHADARPAVQRALRSEDPEIIRAALALTETR
ncbi:MAG TPA: hypothetical protein VF625_13230, partial [Longimicrobium sp.]